MPPFDFGILTLALWALHGKNGTKSRRCPPPLIEGAPRLLNLMTVRYALLPTLLKISVVVSYLANVSV